MHLQRHKYKGFKLSLRTAKQILTLSTLIIIIATTGILGSSCSSEKSGLLIFAAAGSKAPLDEVCRKFEEQYNTQVAINYGGGGEVLSQMILSRSGDVYVAPEQGFMDTAEEKQSIDPETIVNVAYMIPVIAVQNGNPKNITSLADLAKPGIKIAITRTETTLLGQCALDIFSKAGLSEDIEKNIVTQAARPDNLLTMLMMGQIDAGIIWHFYQIQAAKYIETIFLPANQLTGIGEMQAAVSAYSDNKALAQQFIDFMTSDDGRAIFENAGYIVNTEEVKQYWQ